MDKVQSRPTPLTGAAHRRVTRGGSRRVVTIPRQAALASCRAEGREHEGGIAGRARGGRRSPVRVGNGATSRTGSLPTERQLVTAVCGSAPRHATPHAVVLLTSLARGVAVSERERKPSDITASLTFRDWSEISSIPRSNDSQGTLTLLLWCHGRAACRAGPTLERVQRGHVFGNETERATVR